MSLEAKRQKLMAGLGYGVTPALATPLLPDGRTVNLPVVGQLIAFLLERGVAGIFAGGTTGEGILLALEQRMRLHEAAAEAVAGRVPLLVHAGTNSSAGTLELVRHAASLPVAAIVVITPTYYPMPDEALFAYFQAMAGAAGHTPVLAYDIPHMAVNGVSPQLLGRLVAEVPNFAGIKCSRHDAQVIRGQIDSAAGRVAVLAGNERIALGSLALGATGLISGLATAVPEPFVALTGAFRAGDLATAQEWQRRINRMLDCFSPGVRIGGIKAILRARGIAAGAPVPPRPDYLGDDLWPCLERILADGK